MSGQLQQGMLLPSIRELAQDLSCSVITIRRVYQDLEAEGILRTRQGTGTFVAEIDDTDKELSRRETVLSAMREAIEIARSHQYEVEDIKQMFLACLTDEERSD